MSKSIKYVSHTGNKVYWDSEYQEYYVVFKGKTRNDDSTYYTSDKQDAIDTADIGANEHE